MLTSEFGEYWRLVLPGMILENNVRFFIYYISNSLIQKPLLFRLNEQEFAVRCISEFPINYIEKSICQISTIMYILDCNYSSFSSGPNGNNTYSVQARFEDCQPGGSGRIYESLKHKVIVSFNNPLKQQDLRQSGPRNF